MIDMKNTEKPKGGTMLSPVEADTPEYPYGLRLSLEEADLQKLGMTGSPELDSEFKLTALVCVVSVSQHESEGSDGKKRSLSLQIERMELTPAAEEDNEPTPAGKLYRPT